MMAILKMEKQKVTETDFQFIERVVKIHEEELFDKRGDASREGGKGGRVRLRRQLRCGGHERDPEPRPHPRRAASGHRDGSAHAPPDPSGASARRGREHGLPRRLASAVRDHGQRLLEDGPQAREAARGPAVDRDGGLQGQRDDEGDVPAPQGCAGYRLPG